MDLKESVQELHNNETFKHILATLLAIGNFLNGKKVCVEEFCSYLLVNDLSPGQTIATSQPRGRYFRNFWVGRWDPRTLSLYQNKFRLILLPYTRVNPSNHS